MGTEPGGRGGGRVFSKGISDSRLSNELSFPLSPPLLSLSLFHNRVSVRREARVTIREGRARTRPQKYGAAGTLIGTCDGTVMPIN